MSVQTIAAADALARLREFSAVIDARSEGEYAIDRLPGALNWPSLHDDERVRVGTMYKQVNPFEARKLGAVVDIEAGPATVYFASVVVITMFAAESFDPRLLWDVVEEDA